MGKQMSSSCRLCLKISIPCGILIGLLVLVFAVTFHFKFPEVLESEINKRVTVEEGHATYEQLQKPSIPIHKDFYFFNLTNAEEFAFERGGVKPDLAEIGPYSYTEYRIKTFVDDNTTENDRDLIGYTQSKTFYFDSNTSMPGAEETDIICTINIPLVAAIESAKDERSLRMVLRQLINASGAQLYVCQEASALAWNYTDELVAYLHAFGQYPHPYVTIQVNDSIYDRNLSIIHTGVKSISRIGQFKQWNGLEELDIWNNGTGANSINGTEGLFFRPNLKRGDKLTAFIDDIQRSMDLVNTAEVKPLGLTAFRYGVDNRTFKGAFSEPENARWGSWCPDGMFYIGPTQAKEIPVFGSKPHFLDGDPLLLESVIGLEPIRAEHDIIVDVEPNTGANVKFVKQLQINLQINRTEEVPDADFPMYELYDVEGYNGTDTLYYPVLYVKEHSEMDEDFKRYLEDKGLKQLQTLKTAVSAVVGILISVGVVFLLVSFVVCAIFHLRFRHKNGYHTPLLKASST